MSQSTIQGLHRNVLEKFAESNNGKCLIFLSEKNWSQKSHTHTHTHTHNMVSFFSKIFNRTIYLLKHLILF